MIASGRSVVIGAGPNGLVAANLLADAGWNVVVVVVVLVVLPLICARATPEKLASSAASRIFFMELSSGVCRLPQVKNHRRRRQFLRPLSDFAILGSSPD